MWNWFNLASAKKLEGAKRSYTNLRGNYTRLGIPDPETDLKAPLDEFEAALVAADDKNTGEAATRRKDEAEDAFDKAWRNYGNEHLEYNHLVSDVDKDMLDWHVPKDREPIHEPEDEPVITTILNKKREVGFEFRRKGAKRQGKPKKIGACVIRWVMSDTMPTDISQLVNIETITKSPFTLKFNEADRGKKIWYVACWQIERGRLEGPMTAIEFVVIP
jgi:hypothetical protein